MTREELIAECRRRSEAGEDVETIIRYLRVSGCSKIDSIAILKGACGIGLAKAKEIVHFSATWADRKASDEGFHEDIVDALTSEKTRQQE
jgi:ribosomal protein L7/L12